MRLSAENNIPKKRSWKLLPVYLLPAPLFYIILSLYTDNPILQLCLSLVSGILPMHCLLAYKEARQANLNRQLFGHFLQILSSELASGKTFSHAFHQAVLDLSLITGNSTLFMRQLLHARQQLLAQTSLVQVLEELAGEFTCLEARPLLQAYASQLRVNGDIVDLVRFSTSMIQELNDTENEIAAANNRQTVEAFVLSLMPYGMAFLLKTTASSYFYQAYESTLGQVILLVSFCLALIASSGTFWVTSRGFAKPGTLQKHQPSRLSRRLSLCRPLQSLGISLLRLLPQTRLLQLQINLHQLGLPPAAGEEDGPDTRLKEFSALFLPLFLFAFCISLILALRGILPYWLVLLPPVVLLLLYLQRPANQAKLCRESLTLSFPLFSGLTCSLLRSGFVPLRAIELSIRFLSEDQTVLGRELLKIQAAFRSGKPLGQELERVAKGAQVPEIQATMNLIHQYAKNGNSQTLLLLTIQAGVCWTLARNQLRKKRESQSILILAPMMTNLLSIVCLTLAPVVVSFT